MSVIRVIGLCVIWVLLCGAAEPSWEYKVLAGGEISEATHGVFNLGIKYGDLTAELHTDTLELRWDKELGFGRSWIGARFAAFAAELFIAPWKNGSYAPERGVRAMYGELSSGYVHYLPKHFYAGIQVEARRYQFAASGAAVTTEDIPADTFRLKSTTFVGYWTKPLKARLQGGIEYLTDAQEDITPWFQGELLYHPNTWLLTPFTELRAGLLVSESGSSSPIIGFRVGGMNPYVIPVAGWSWAEAWAQYYAASRVGMEYQVQSFGASVFVDYAYLAQDDVLTEQALGAGGAMWWLLGSWRIDLAAGYAPVANRAPQAKIPPISGWISLAPDWQSF